MSRIVVKTTVNDVEFSIVAENEKAFNAIDIGILRFHIRNAIRTELFKMMSRGPSFSISASTMRKRVDDRIGDSSSSSAAAAAAEKAAKLKKRSNETHDLNESESSSEQEFTSEKCLSRSCNPAECPSCYQTLAGKAARREQRKRRKRNAPSF